MGLIPTDSVVDITAEAADERTAKALDIDAGTSVLRSTSITYLEGGRPLERTIGWFIGTRYSYRIRQGHSRQSSFVAERGVPGSSSRGHGRSSPSA